MPDEKQPDATAPDKPDWIQIAELIKSLAFQIKTQITNSESERRGREQREAGDRAQSFKWYKTSIVLSVATLVVLIATLVEVRWYTQDASIANSVSQQALEATTRPYLKLVPQGQLIDDLTAGRAIRMNIFIINYGKLPTVANARTAITYSRDALPAPGLASAVIRKLVWPEGDNAIISAQAEQPLSAGDVTDMKAGVGFVYLEAETNYRDYVTRVCWKYPLRTDAVLLGDPVLCDDPKANCTDEDCRKAPI
jgi:hypothetical protein